MTNEEQKMPQENRTQSIAMGVVALIVVVILAGVALIMVRDARGLPILPAQQRHVMYSITGSAETVSITITNELGGKEQHRVHPPWVMEFPARRGQFVYLSAQNQGRGSITSCITVDGQILQQAQTTETYGIAMASGAVR